MTERVWRLEVDEPADRNEGLVALRRRERWRQGGLRVDHGVPRLALVQTAEDPLGLGAQDLAQPRVELLARAAVGDVDRALDAAGAVRDLHELRELRDPAGDRD